MWKSKRANSKIVKELAKERENIIERVFGNSDSFFAGSWVLHDVFMIGYSQAFANAFIESFTKNFDQGSSESIEPEAFKQREAERRQQALRYLLPYCTTLRFPELASQALEQAQQLESPEQLQTMLYLLLLAQTDEEARSALSVKETSEGTNFVQGIVDEGSKEGLKDGEKKGLGEALLQIIEARFPTLLTQAKLVIEQQTSVEQLRTLFNKFCQAKTIEDAQAVLLPNG